MSYTRNLSKITKGFKSESAPLGVLQPAKGNKIAPKNRSGSDFIYFIMMVKE